MKNLLLTLIVVALAAGCAQLDRKVISDVDSHGVLAPLKLGMGTEFYKLRIDLVRNTRTETRTVTSTDENGNSVTRQESVAVNVPYSYIGLDFGNGLFLDSNYNLSLNLSAYREELKGKAFSVTEKIQGLFAPDITYIRSGERFEREVKALFGEKTIVTFSASQALINENIFASNQTVTWSDDLLIYDSNGLFEQFSNCQVAKINDGYKLTGFWKENTFRQTDANTIRLDEFLKIEYYGKKITFTYIGLFGITNTFTFIKVGNRIFFYNSSFFGVEITLDASQVKVAKNGNPYGTYLFWPATF